MGIFKKKKVKKEIKLKLEEVKNFIESSFKDSDDYDKIYDIKSRFQYETGKLIKYSELLLSRDFSNKIIQDRDYFKKIAAKVVDETKDFLSRIEFPESVFLYSSFIEKAIREIEELESNILSNINYFEDIIPNLVSRFKIKIQSISELIIEFNRILKNIDISVQNKINDYIKEYYSLEEEISKLKNKRAIILEDLTKVNTMRDKVESRLNSLRSKRGMKSLNDLLENRDVLKSQLDDHSSVLKLNFSYINQILPEIFVETKSWIGKFVSDDDIISNKDIEIVKVQMEKLLTLLEDQDNITQLTDENFNKVKDLLINIKSFIVESESMIDDIKKLQTELNGNMLYLEFKEKEDSFNLWNSKSNSFKSEIKIIDDKISDISLSLIKQRINEQLKKISGTPSLE